MSFPLSSLPDELALSCLLRVSRFDYRALSLVSKRYKSLVVSPEFYKMRSLLGYTKKSFYLCLSTSHNSTPLWFTLRLENPGNRFMSPIPSFPSQPPDRGSSVLALDWGIYVIGGLISEKPISDVLLLDCRTHTWSKLPSMGVARAHAAAGVVDGKIHVVGGCEDNDSLNWGEVFDPKTQTWDTLGPMPDWRKGDEKIYSVRCGDEVSVYYSPNDYLKLGIISYCCVIEKLVYYSDGQGNLTWRELEGSEWKEVKGLESIRNIFAMPDDILLDLIKYYNELRNFGDNVVLIWFKYNDKNVEIWCAEISFERRREENGDEIWGTVEWLGAVATLDRNLVKYQVDIFNAAFVNV